MSEYEQIFHKQELYEMFSKGEASPLDDLYGIEDIALSIKELKKELDFLKGYKNKKVADITSKVGVIERKIDFFKKVILLTLTTHNEKSVDFPGSCMVTSKNQQGKWDIVDEEEFISIIEKAEADGEKVEGVIEEVKETVIRKKPANELLDTWEKNGNFEKYFGNDETPCVIKEAPKRIVSFSYPKTEDNEGVVDETASVANVPAPTKEAEFDAI